MPVQSLTDRFLMQADAAATYRTAAQVDTAADARITVQKAQPSGLASLGADGKVPSAQLPPANTVFLRAKLADTSTTATTYTADPDLSIASLPVGLYALTAHLVTIAAPVATTNVLLRNATSTAVVVSYPLIGTNATSGGATPANAFLTDVNTAAALGSVAQGRRDWTGHLQVTTAGSFTVGLASATSGSAAGLGVGSYLMLTKVG